MERPDVAIPTVGSLGMSLHAAGSVATEARAWRGNMGPTVGRKSKRPVKNILIKRFQDLNRPHEISGE